MTYGRTKRTPLSVGGAKGFLLLLRWYRDQSYLPVVPGVNQPGAVTPWRVEVGVVRRAEGAVEVPQPFTARWNITVDLIAEVLKPRQQGHNTPDTT